MRKYIGLQISPRTLVYTYRQILDADLSDVRNETQVVGIVYPSEFLLSDILCVCRDISSWGQGIAKAKIAAITSPPKL